MAVGHAGGPPQGGGEVYTQGLAVVVPGEHSATALPREDMEDMIEGVNRIFEASAWFAITGSSGQAWGVTTGPLSVLCR
jgi:hypothetical protein